MRKQPVGLETIDTSRSLAGSMVTSLPPIRILPDVGCSRPASNQPSTRAQPFGTLAVISPIELLPVTAFGLVARFSIHSTRKQPA